ncbi:hypothetical protein L0P50_15420 [Lawsonibacter sp. DFI.6.74]|nr:hypothetical protein [Lawsonibacter sp. DFI.6.74]MCG4771789.1 hypothetical protein [Lawsonibacter sp. DFI.5.51]
MNGKSSLTKVVIRHDSTVTSVKVDGKELGDKVSKITFTQHGGQIPVVALEIPLDEVDIQTVGCCVFTKKGRHKKTVHARKGGTEKGGERDGWARTVPAGRGKCGTAEESV